MCGPSYKQVINHQHKGQTVFMEYHDSVLCFEVKHWPEEVLEEWRNRPRLWPPEELLEQVVKMPCQLVFKPQWHKDKSKENPLELKLTFTRAETLLAQNRNLTQQLVNLISKAIYYKYLKFEIEDREFPSYFIKTSLNWMLEETEPNEWTEDHCFDLVKRLLQRLCKYLTDGFMPYYFNPKINLLLDFPKQLIEIAISKLKGILENLDEAIPTDEEVYHVINEGCQRVFKILEHTPKSFNFVASNLIVR